MVERDHLLKYLPQTDEPLVEKQVRLPHTLPTGHEKSPQEMSAAKMQDPAILNLHRRVRLYEDSAEQAFNDYWYYIWRMMVMAEENFKDYSIIQNVEARLTLWTKT